MLTQSISDYQQKQDKYEEDKIRLTSENGTLKQMNTKLGNDFEKMCGVRPVALNSTIMDKSQYAPTDRGSVISTMRPDNADKQEQKIRELQKRVSQASVYISM